MSKGICESNYQINQYGFLNESGIPDLIVDINHITSETPLPLHYHPMLEISLFVTGNGTYLIGNRTYSIETGDIFIIRNTEPHRVIMPVNKTADNLVIHFDPGLLWNLYGNTHEVNVLGAFFNTDKTTASRLDRNNPHKEELSALFFDILNSFKNPPVYHKLTVLIQLQYLLTKILNYYNYSIPVPKIDTLTRQEQFNIDAVINYINDNLESHLTLEELAGIACLNPAYFSSIFKKYAGASLFKYITAVRIKHAQHLILTTNKSYSKIAACCGFNSSTSFNRAFKRISGMSPSGYKKLCSESLYSASHKQM